MLLWSLNASLFKQKYFWNWKTVLTVYKRKKYLQILNGFGIVFVKIFLYHFDAIFIILMSLYLFILP